ncbi:MAG: zinc ribbon domain-containing protein [Sulfolobales archaeon]
MRRQVKRSSSRMMRCSRCGFTGDRDLIACINIFLRYSRCRSLEVLLKAFKTL